MGLATCVLSAPGVGVGAPAAAGCGGPDAACRVDLGRYRAVAPGDDTPAGAVVYLHGYQGSAKAVMHNRGLVRAVREAGYLLVAPHGRDGTWNHVGSPAGHDRDELAFLDQVRRDVRRRFDLAGKPILLAGFSQGASMVWDVACYRGGYTGFAAVAGAFWQPLPQSCPAAGIALTHVHGLDDDVVPLEGRPIGDGWRQGDTHRALALLKRHNACPPGPDRRSAAGALRCKHWTSCRRGRVQVCLHDGGHTLKPAWVARAIAWIRRRGG